MSQHVPDKRVKLPFLAVPRRCPQRGICGEGNSLAGFSSGLLASRAAQAPGLAGKAPVSWPTRCFRWQACRIPALGFLFSAALGFALNFCGRPAGLLLLLFFLLAFKLFFIYFFRSSLSTLLFSLEQTLHLFDHRQTCKSFALESTLDSTGPAAPSLLAHAIFLFVYAPAKRNVKIHHHRPHHRTLLDSASLPSFRSSFLETELEKNTIL